jgi:multidrug efflux pump subunit AcrB
VDVQIVQDHHIALPKAWRKLRGDIGIEGKTSMFGLASSTLLTVLAIPAIYLVLLGGRASAQ